MLYGALHKQLFAMNLAPLSTFVSKKTRLFTLRPVGRGRTISSTYTDCRGGAAGISGGSDPGNSIVNRSAYPSLSSPDFVKQCRAQLAQLQTCRLPNFLTERACGDLLDFVKSEVNNGHVKHPGTTYSTIYYQEPDFANFPEGHVMTKVTSRSNTYITANRIPAGLSLRVLQDDPAFQQFLEAVTGESLFEYSCPVSKFVFSLSGPGDHQDWHFDNNFLTLTFMLQEPEAGGLLEVYPRIGRENYTKIGQILDTSAYALEKDNAAYNPFVPRIENHIGALQPSGLEEPLRFEYEVGDMILFTGRDSLHRATKVVGDKTRIIGIVSYNTEGFQTLPNAVHMEKVYSLSREELADKGL